MTEQIATIIEITANVFLVGVGACAVVFWIGLCCRAARRYEREETARDHFKK